MLDIDTGCSSCGHKPSFIYEIDERYERRCPKHGGVRR